MSLSHVLQGARTLLPWPPSDPSSLMSRAIFRTEILHPNIITANEERSSPPVCSSETSCSAHRSARRLERGPPAAAVQDDAWITSGDEEEGRGRRKTKNYLQMSSWRAATGAHSQVIFSVLAAMGMGRGSAPFHSFHIVLALHPREERTQP